MVKTRYRFIEIFLVLFLISLSCRGEELKIGMSTALSGPLKEVGSNMRLGYEMYFERINREGGVNGYTFKLIVRDDGYEPARTAINMRKLIDEDQVVAIVGNVGTPTATVALPIILEKQILFFAPMTGARFLRLPQYQDYVFNTRASYEDETAEMIRGLLTMGIRPKEIAFFTQNDSYGEAGFKGAVRALEEQGFHDISQLVHARYRRNSLNVEDAVADILDAEIEPKAVIMVGSYQPAAKFIRLMRKEIPGLIYLNVSFVGSEALVEALGGDVRDVVVTQVVPPYRSSLPVAIEYRKALSEYSPETRPGFVSFEGYIAAKIFVQTIASVKGDINRNKIRRTFASLDHIDVGTGRPLSFNFHGKSSTRNVWLTAYHSGEFVPVEWDELAVNRLIVNFFKNTELKGYGSEY